MKKENRFFETEEKCMVIKADDKFIVYITIQGKRINFNNIKEVLNVDKVRLAISEELKENFGA